MSYRTKYVNLATTGQVAAGECWLAGMYVNSTSSGTLMLLDYTSNTGIAWAIGGTITPAIGYHNLGNVHLTRGCYARFAGTSLNVTFHILEANT